MYTHNPDREPLTSVYIAEDESLFASILEDSLRLSGLADNARVILTADEAETAFKEATVKPSLIFVDINLAGSSYDGVELIRRINFEHGNGCAIGVISSSCDEGEIARAVKAGAMFWIVKTHDIDMRIESFASDIDGYLDRSAKFKIYK